MSAFSTQEEGMPSFNKISKRRSKQMKDKRRPMCGHILISLTFVLTLLFAMPGVAPAARETARVDRPDAGTTTPAGLTDGEWATLQDLIRQAEYQFAWQVNGDGEWAYRAPNLAQGLSLSLAADGFHAARYREGEPLWEFGIFGRSVAIVRR
jgi:hypothetical protein